MVVFSPIPRSSVRFLCGSLLLSGCLALGVGRGLGEGDESLNRARVVDPKTPLDDAHRVRSRTDRHLRLKSEVDRKPWRRSQTMS